LRKDPNKRVFYINDPATFRADPKEFFAEESKERQEK